MLTRLAVSGGSALLVLGAGACTPGRPAGVAPPTEPRASVASSPAVEPSVAVGSTAAAAEMLGPTRAGTQPESAAPALVRLTEPGCCPLPFWAADGRTVLFWSRSEGGETGVYGVPSVGGPTLRVADVPAGVHLGGRFTTMADGDEVVLTRTEDSRQWRFDTQGQSLVLSADGAEVAWVQSLGESVPGADPPPRVHWRARLDGGGATRVEVAAEYALSDWTASGDWLLARVQRDRADLPALVRFDPDSGRQEPLLDGRRLRSFRTSPGRTWLAVTRVFEDDPADNGLYLVATDGAVPARRLDLVGGYQWRDDERLLVVPMQPGAPGMAVWQVEADSGRAERVVDPVATRLRIAAGEWSASPGGAHIAFRSADDDAIWALTLPPVEPGR